MHLRIPLLAALTVIGVVASVAPSSYSAYPGEEGRIAFVRDGEIWTADADGSDELRLTQVGTAETPVWSPDGRRIAFAWDRRALPTGADIWTMAADGSDKRPATSDRAWETSPSWSPNGRWIAFTSDHEGVGSGDYDIYKIRWSVEAARTRQLTDGGVSAGGVEAAGDTDPAWSPLGDVIAFRRVFSDGGCSACGFSEMWTVTRDGETEVRLSGDGSQLSWSPYGERIAYVDYTLSGDDLKDSNDVYHMAADGTDHRPVTSFGEGSWRFAYQPAWSPDHGERILFTYSSSEDRDPGIWMIGSHGGEAVRIIDHGTDPDWQPA